jgi:hypothetical protein
LSIIKKFFQLSNKFLPLSFALPNACGIVCFVSHRPPVRITQTVRGITKKQTPRKTPLRISVMIFTFIFGQPIADLQEIMPEIL